MSRSLLAAVLAAALAGCGQSPAPRDARAGQSADAATASAHEAGRKIYNFRCYYCHGYSGDARTLAAGLLDPKPRDFTADTAEKLPRERILSALREGRAGTAMKSFASVLSAAELELVADFVREEFIVRKSPNTRYHTEANGWPDHERYRAAFPFAIGELPVDAPWESLLPEQAAGKRLYFASCVSCHDRGTAPQPPSTWEMRSVSYPPNVDACVGCHRYSKLLHSRRSEADGAHATRAERLTGQVSDPAYAVHDVGPRVADLAPRERRGEALFQQNCAFCHAADGTGKNWIGAFLEPHPRDLSDPAFLARMSRKTLADAIRNGVPGTSMPAWRSVLGSEDIEALVSYLDRAFGPLGERRQARTR